MSGDLARLLSSNSAEQFKLLGPNFLPREGESCVTAVYDGEDVSVR